jgi:hypothetical protein
MRAVATHSRVAVRSSHKAGKSSGSAALALWWLYTKERALVIMTSAGHRQVSEILWPEVKRLHRNALTPLGGKLSISPNGGLTLPDGRRLFGFATEDTERMGGYSGSNLLFIVDEASGVSKEIFEAIEGNRAGGASLFMIGNPTQTAGVFYDAFTSKRDFWKTLHISAYDTPNSTKKEPAVAGLATPEWIEEKRKEWGPKSPLFAIRVLGEFPSQAANSVIGLQALENSIQKWRPPQPEDGPLEIGCDPARYGADETVIVARRGLYAYDPITLKNMSGPEVAGQVIELARRLVWRDSEGRALEKPIVKVDVIGVGASVFDALSPSTFVETVGINVAESAGDDLHERLRDRVWFAAAEWLANGGALPPHSGLQAELISPTYSFTPRGRRKVESKDELRKRTGRSPDHADAFCLAIYNAPVFHAEPAGPEALDFLKY